MKASHSNTGPVARILIVENFPAFRRFIGSTLGESLDLRIIAEVSDGLEAVQKAAELKPGLILLDIGLPTINGIEAARQIRKLSPESKIVFLSQETSADVVEEALGTGECGYVTKIKAQVDLLAAVEAALSGKTLSVTYQQLPISTSRVRRNSATEWDIASTYV
jgi:DNA-binding NarL/FixJ family response regulator